LISKKRQEEALKLFDDHMLLKEFINDWRIIAIYYECVRKKSNIVCLQYIQTVIKILEVKTKRNDVENNIYFKAYCHLITTYLNLSNDIMAIKTIEKQEYLIKKTTIDSEIKKNIIETLLFSSIFLYDYDISNLFDEIKILNTNNKLQIKNIKKIIKYVLDICRVIL